MIVGDQFKEDLEKRIKELFPNNTISEEELKKYRTTSIDSYVPRDENGNPITPKINQ